MDFCCFLLLLQWESSRITMMSKLMLWWITQCVWRSTPASLLMWNCDEEEGGGGGEAARESSRLLPSKKKSGRGGGEGSNYGGTGSSPDLETGSNATSSSSSDDELYDGQICVICYDDQRDCFFVPCGHCIACHTCAARIMKEESKSCPICRGIIEKIRKLHIL
ncbi:E3 ubiquitin-protein ligase APD1-like isoform X2 [Andrographis paniculata]|uniref:E3 ubiquitin-protein ligase APD1-like isoform X2 n=1 Tax=Andrographis paniculata TaxID=175694 RepID=UPI0021E94A9A|nr:E3 ubiquitin-protein ligase APD1-like isoform X2 [Andrographis paniculata]